MREALCAIDSLCAEVKMEAKPNWFVRILIIALVLLLVALGVYNVIHTNPPGQITTGIIVVIGFVVILVLSEAFDNFSLARIISLSRAVGERDQQIVDLRHENAELRAQIVNITTSVNQRQVSTNFVGLPDRVVDLLTVRPADEVEVEEKEQEEVERAEVGHVHVGGTPNYRRMEEIGLRHFLRKEGLEQLPFIKEAKLVSQFHGVDPISDTFPIYDAYLKTAETEIFVEVRPETRGTAFFRDRLYVMLSKIHHYRRVSGTNAFLALVLVSLPDDGRRVAVPTERLLESFQPAMSNGLLKVHRVEPTEAELREILQPA